MRDSGILTLADAGWIDDYQSKFCINDVRSDKGCDKFDKESRCRSTVRAFVSRRSSARCGHRISLCWGDTKKQRTNLIYLAIPNQANYLIADNDTPCCTRWSTFTCYRLANL